MPQKAKLKAVVAMSSGVDSSVAAALLKKQGYDVVGVFMHFWKEPGQDELRENKCCSLEAQEDARKVCQILDIPLYTANVAREFKKEVVDYFLAESKAGRTPNPCVICNEKIKFRVLFQKLLESRADVIASGHYARIKEKIDRKTGRKTYHLLAGLDPEKDQSYFLHRLNQKQLAKVRFPIGGYRKPAIRKIAQKLKLPIFDKDDSQGLCFTPEKYPTEFLKRHLKLNPGKIMELKSGKAIGQHDGLAVYTIGQRRGINIGGTGPYYVVRKDLKKNLLWVTNDENDPALETRELTVSDVVWTVAEPKLPGRIKIKIRYRNPFVRATIEKSTRKSGRYLVKLDSPQRAVTPGQSAVFYAENGEVLGGGRIEE